MTRVVSVLVGALVAAAFGVVAASPAHADVTSELDYAISGGDPTMTSPLGTDGNPCVADATVGSYHYKVLTIVVSATGSYDFRDVGASEGRFSVYGGAFSPTAVGTNCLASFSENSAGATTVALTAGTVYTFVESTESSGAMGALGEFSIDAHGPGAVQFTTTTSLIASPTPSELSKTVTLTATVAGGNTTPTGTVQFKDGATVLGSAPLSASGVASLATKTLGVGDHTLSATYSGDTEHATSTGTKTHKVKYGPKPKVKFTISDKEVPVGDKVKLTWITSGADTVKASGDWKGKKDKKGSTKVKIKTLGVHIFKLKVGNVNGFTKAKVKVVAVRAAKEFTVTLPDDVLSAGTKVRVKAVKLDAKERFKVFLDDELLAKGFADKKGLASALAALPKDTKEGEHTLSVMGSNEDRVGEVDIQVVTPTKDLAVEVESTKVKVNETNVVSVTGLVVGEDVTVMYQGEVLAEGVADEDGKFEYTFAVGDQSGKQTITIIGQVPGRKGDAEFKVTGSAGGTDPL